MGWRHHQGAYVCFTTEGALLKSCLAAVHLQENAGARAGADHHYWPGGAAAAALETIERWRWADRTAAAAWAATSPASCSD